jgi:hypothetical protein
MAVIRHPYLECKNGGCRRPIWLPHTSRLDKAPHQPLTPTDSYFESYVCPVCVHVYDYSPQDILYDQLHSEAQARIVGLHASILEFRCGVNNCGLRTLIHRPTMERLEPAKLVRESGAWVLAGVHCQNGHQIETLPPEPNRYANIYATDFP